MSDIVNSELTIEEPLTKPKKPRTAKQLEAFEKVKEKRKQNVEMKKQQKLLESAKLLVENEKVKNVVQPKVVRPKTEELEEQSESEEEEVILIERRKKPKPPPKPPAPKKKVRKIIIESESDSDSDDSISTDEGTDKRIRIIRPRQNPGDFFC